MKEHISAAALRYEDELTHRIALTRESQWLAETVDRYQTCTVHFTGLGAHTTESYRLYQVSHLGYVDREEESMNIPKKPATDEKGSERRWDHVLRKNHKPNAATVGTTYDA